MAIALSTAGVTIKYLAESTAGVKPTTGTWTQIAGIKSISDLNPEPSQLDCTPLEELEWKQYIPGLKDIGGVVSLTANNTDTFQTAWAALVTAAKALTGGLSMCFQIVVPGLTKAFFFSGMPSDLGLTAVEVDSVLDVDAYITPSKVFGWDTKST